jgi:hypothetical protein
MSAAKPSSRVLAVRITILGLVVAPCYADIPEVAFGITTEAGPVSVKFEILADWGTYDCDTRTWAWSLPETHTFWSERTPLASLDEFDATIVEDPEAEINFSGIQSGPVDTHFNIASGLITFAPLVDPVGWASTTYTLTDTDGDGATLSGVYLLQYNGWAGDPSGPQGTTFAECVFSMFAGPFETVSTTCSVPPTVILDVVYDMSLLASFDLSANDMASGVATFAIVPCFGDLDGDDHVGLSDLAQLLANYGTTSGAGYGDADLDADDDVDLDDLAALLAVYGTTCD